MHPQPEPGQLAGGALGASSPKHPTSYTASTHTNMCKPAPPSSKDETITNGLSLEGVHVGTVNLMISSGTVILILFAVFF